MSVKGRQGHVDKSGSVRVPAIFDRASPFSEGLAQVIAEGMAGFVNSEGQTVIPPSYWKAGSFRGGLAPVCRREKCGFVNATGRVAIPFEYDDAGDFSSGLAPVRTGRLWGYIDRQGRWVVKPGFDEALPFREDLALVGKRVDRQPDKGFGGYTGPTVVYGFLDRTGHFFVEPAILRASPFSEGLAAIQVPADGFCSDCYATSYLRRDGTQLPHFRWGSSFQDGTAVVTALGVSGESGFLIDRKGEALVEFHRARQGEAPTTVGALLRLRYGYVDREGRVAIPHIYSIAEPFSEGLGLVEGGERRAPWRPRFVDRTGAVRLEVPRDAGRVRPFSSGFALLSMNRGSDTAYAYIDKAGAVRIEAAYAEARSFSEGLAAVKVTHEPGRADWGYLNVRGELTIPPTFHKAGPFHQGLASVTLLRDNILSGAIIDSTGKVVAESFYPDYSPSDDEESYRRDTRLSRPRNLIPVRTREGFAYAGRDGRIVIRDSRYIAGDSFSEDLAAVMVGDGGPFAVWGYIDTTGKLVIPARFQEAHGFSGGLALVKDETGRYGYIHREGGWAIRPAFFEKAHDFHEGRALVRINGFHGFLNPEGDLIIRPKYPRATSFREGLASTGVAQ